MLRVFKASGEEVLAIQFTEFVERYCVDEQPVLALGLKRHLQSLCGLPRFRQRLLLPDGQILSDDATLKGPVDVQLILLPFSESSGEQVQELCDAAQKNDVTSLEKLLQRPLDPNLETLFRRVPLFIAASCGSSGAVRLLLEACADKDWANTRGITPIFMASSFGHVEVVRLLLEARADKSRADNFGATPMSVAARYGHAAVEVLLEAGNESL